MRIQVSMHTEDDGLNFNVTFQAKENFPTESISIAGAAEWRHFPANIVGLSKNFINALKATENDFSKNLARVGMTYVGFKSSDHDILVPYTVRHGKPEKVIKYLQKVLKAIGGSSISIREICK